MVSPLLNPAQCGIPTGQIAGRVSAADTRLPLADVDIGVISPSGALIAEAVTNASGLYTVTNLLPGVYKLELNTPSDSDYASEWYADQVDQESATLVNVAANSITTADAALVRGGRITGRVTAADSGAALDVIISAYWPDGRFAASALTNASGYYTLTGLFTGSYQLNFSPNASGVSAGYLSENYDGQRSERTATLVNVNVPTTTGDINATLEPGGQISGRVTALGLGRPIGSVNITVYDENDVLAGSASSASDGFYTVLGLPSGAYQVRFSGGFGDSTDFLTRYYPSMVAVSAPLPTQAVDIALAAGGRIGGRVTDLNSGLPLTGIRVNAYDSAGRLTSSALTAANGVYTVTRLPGDSYRLQFESATLSTVGYASEYYDDQATLMAATPLVVTEGASLTSMNAVLRWGSQISGRVTAADTNQPLTDVTITLYDSEGRAVRVTRVIDCTGSYRFYGLPSGRYRIHFAPAQASEEYLPQFYPNHSNLAAAGEIELTIPNVASNIDARLARAGRIAGLLRAADTNLPLNGVYVEIYDQEEKLIDAVRTGASGRYLSSSLKPGSYWLKFKPAGAAAAYMSEFYNDHPESSFGPDIGFGESVVVTAGVVTSGIDATLALGAAIQGQITAAYGGAAISDVRVSLYRNVVCSDTTSFEGIASTLSDGSGRYHLAGMPNGDFRLAFETSAAQEYLSEAYNDKVSLSEGMTLTLRAPNALTGVDAALARGGSIRGRITAADNGLPLKDVLVSFWDSSGDEVKRVYSNGTGGYQSGGLPASAYRVKFEPAFLGGNVHYAQEYYENQATLTAAQLVTVTAGLATASVDAVLERGGVLTGKVIAQETSLPLADVLVTLYDSSGQAAATVRSGKLGDYRFLGVRSGSYRLRFVYQLERLDRCRATTVSEFYNDKLDLASATVLTLNEGQEAQAGLTMLSLTNTPPFSVIVHLPWVQRFSPSENE
jgi:protocatechuate 3,4-dioxygenase beta subunit